MADLTAHQISFILNKHRYQENFLVDAEEGRALGQRLRQAQKRLRDEGFGLALTMDMSDLQVYPLMPHSGNIESALALVATIADALDVALDDKTLAAVLVTAEALDALVGGLPEDQIQTVNLDFTWNNGGGDDNGYSDCFCSTRTPPRAGGAFEAALENWMEAQGHGYDMVFQNREEAQATMCAGEALDGLGQTLLDNSGGDPASLLHAWGLVLTGEAAAWKALERASNLDQTLPAASEHRSTKLRV